MGGNGGGPPFIKKEEESDSNCISICRIENNNNDNNHLHLHHVQKNEDTSNSRGISIAERRGFNASNMNAAHFNTAAPAPAPAFFTVPAGISPSALLDSPVMLPNVQAQLSPTTGTFQLLSPNHESLKLKLKLSCDGDGDGDGDGEDAVPMETCELVNGLSEPNNFMNEINNKPLEEEMRQNQMMLEVKTERSLQDHRNHHHHQKSSSSGAMVNKNSDDGFYWRKYGQKHVKGSEYPRSYYKCTNSNCVVTKKVERSHDGHITEIVYKGSHNHPQPQPLKTTVDGASTSSAELRPDQPSPSFLNDSSFQPAPQEFAADEASPESAEDDDGEAKKRKRESLGSETAVPRSSREPKVVVQIESDIDILDDGYRWRKYGQKVVKGNPNPRSYYKCTTPGCPVRKHVERAADDIKSVITTYEGKHNHDVPSSKNGTVISADNVANLPPASKAAGKQQVQDLPLYLDRKTILNYKELMPPNLNLYPLPFPPFHSLPPPPPPTYGPLLITTNPTYRASSSSSSSKLYPIMPDFVPPPPPMPSSHAAHHHYGPPTSYAPHHQLHPSPTPLLPKEEQLRDEDQLYDTTCLSLPNQGNGTSM